MDEEGIPEWVLDMMEANRTAQKQEEEEEKNRVYGRGARKKDEIIYFDSLTDKEFAKVIVLFFIACFDIFPKTIVVGNFF